MLGMMAALWLAVLVIGTTAFADQPFLCLSAAGFVAGVVLFLTRRTGLLARRRAREG
ncbi:hypothetical protein ACGFI9_26825 [Micromonospora sp. NPDC048930]|uniref:hypothetical protein n=1 Tax=Micromonospora sp. NPDC048930 TaxID=3364261 RepID=UPI00371CBB10